MRYFIHDKDKGGCGYNVTRETMSRLFDEQTFRCKNCGVTVAGSAVTDVERVQRRPVYLTLSADMAERVKAAAATMTDPDAAGYMHGKLRAQGVGDPPWRSGDYRAAELGDYKEVP